MRLFGYSAIGTDNQHELKSSPSSLSHDVILLTENTGEDSSMTLESLPRPKCWEAWKNRSLHLSPDEEEL
jgi:hypothetical protein